MKYFGLKVHFSKMNSTLSKLVTTAAVLQSITETEAKTLTDSEQFQVTDLTINAIFAYEVLFILLVTYGFYKIFVSLYKWYNFHNLGFAQTQETLHKYLLFDKTDLFIQLTKTFGARTVQIHLGTFFGNPEDIKITGKMANTYSLEFEHGYLLDILSFNWNSFILNLRGMPLVLPLSITLTGFNRILIRGIMKSENGMFKIIACNKSNCHLTVLQPYTKIQNLPTTNKTHPIKPLRLNLKEPLCMDMGNNMIPTSPQPTNMTLQKLFNQSCFPIDYAHSNGTKQLDRSDSSLSANQMGDYPRSAEVDQNPSQTETQERSTVQGVGETSDIAEGSLPEEA